MPTSIPVELEVADLIHSVNRRIRHATYQNLDPLGVTPAQARALRVLHRAGGRIQMSELADRLRIARRSATSVVDELAARGLVERATDPLDRRAVVVAPTAEGVALLAHLTRRRHGAARRVLAPLSADQVTALRDLLRQVEAD